MFIHLTIGDGESNIYIRSDRIIVVESVPPRLMPLHDSPPTAKGGNAYVTIFDGSRATRHVVDQSPEEVMAQITPFHCHPSINGFDLNLLGDLGIGDDHTRSVGTD